MPRLVSAVAMPLKTLAIVVASALGLIRLSKLRRRRIGTLRALGLSVDVRELRNIAVGIAIAALAIGVVFLVTYATQTIELQSVRSPATLLNDLGRVIAVAAVEELLFRAALLGGLLVLLPKSPWLSIACSAAVFGGLHALNQHATPLAVLGSTIGGIYYGIAFAATQRIWLSFGLHFGWNYALGPVFGFHLSGAAPIHASLMQQRSVGASWFTGGEYGPEGGVVGLLGRVLVIVAVFLWLAYSGRRRSLTVR